MEAIEVKIQLKHYSYIYRTIVVDINCDFLELHYYIQKLFWFDNDHMWDFRYSDWINKVFLRDPFNEYLDFNSGDIEADKINVIELKKKWIKKIKYVYDYWDNWEFDINLGRKIKIKDEQNCNIPFVKKVQWPSLIEDIWWIWWLTDYLEYYENWTFPSEIYDCKEDFDENMREIHDLSKFETKNFLIS